MQTNIPQVYKYNCELMNKTKNKGNFGSKPRTVHPSFILTIKALYHYRHTVQ